MLDLGFIWLIHVPANNSAVPVLKCNRKWHAKMPVLYFYSKKFRMVTYRYSFFQALIGRSNQMLGRFIDITHKIRLIQITYIHYSKFKNYSKLHQIINACIITKGLLNFYHGNPCNKL